MKRIMLLVFLCMGLVVLDAKFTYDLVVLKGVAAERNPLMYWLILQLSVGPAMLLKTAVAALSFTTVVVLAIRFIEARNTILWVLSICLCVYVALIIYWFHGKGFI